MEFGNYGYFDEMTARVANQAQQLGS